MGVETSRSLNYRDFDVFWEGHATVRIVDSGFTVAVDPFSPTVGDWTADLVLITHRDEGHYDPDALEKVCADGTCVVVPEGFDEEEIPCMDVETITENEIIDIFNIEIEAVPMYNDHHERGEGFGYRFVMADTSFYVAGDTGLIDEAFDLEKRVDLAFLPVEGVYTMDVEEAVKTAVRIKPDTVIPYHYGPPFFDGEVNLKGLKSELEKRSINTEVLEAIHQ
jgi:L-ascorbate metabolism protein UlaG (beta-lactamase superfamily)